MGMSINARYIAVMRGCGISAPGRQVPRVPQGVGGGGGGGGEAAPPAISLKNL
jgi:hypothetical protein